MAEGPPDNNGVNIGFPLNWRAVPDISHLKWKSLLCHLDASNTTVLAPADIITAAESTSPSSMNAAQLPALEVNT